MNYLNDSDITVLMVKLACLAVVAAIVLAFACWRLHRRKDGVVPVRRKKSWEVAFDKWLANNGGHGLRHS
ncbi:hypothetical protein [Fibrobacter succinogenes]|uniref:hypothetical protein n=1 Tax=Fibrobacter succinogenes TaxID=833 RepID=UPI001566DC5F|nr:hypothetical protein [Fibrobacter succinogenes]